MHAATVVENNKETAKKGKTSRDSPSYARICSNVGPWRSWFNRSMYFDSSSLSYTENIILFKKDIAFFYEDSVDAIGLGLDL
jgi:hypothetical protein